MQQFLSTFVLPPVGLLVLVVVVLAWLAWRDRRHTAWIGLYASLGLLALATPEVSQWLRYSLERDVAGYAAAAPGIPSPGAIIILGGDTMQGGAGTDIGPLTLERLRAGAALARRTGLPILVTGGPNRRPGDPPLAALMAQALAEDFATPARWRESKARDTHDNAVFSVAMLRAEGIPAAYVVSQGWHLPRAVEAFARLGYPIIPVPVRTAFAPDGSAGSWWPRADAWSLSWYSLREWVGRLVYALRD
jgi:uncharacterized SAM-binding protein YcdF (DUF218 family)